MKNAKKVSSIKDFLKKKEKYAIIYAKKEALCKLIGDNTIGQLNVRIIVYQI